MVICIGIRQMKEQNGATDAGHARVWRIALTMPIEADDCEIEELEEQRILFILRKCNSN